MKNKHMLIMFICCLAPIVGFGVAFLLGIPLGTLGIVALLLLCPVGHIIMMRSMGKDHAGHDHAGPDHTAETGETKKA